MPTARLTFLYPHLFRSISRQTSRQRCPKSSNPSPRRGGASRSFISSSQNHEQVFLERHGKAVEPFLAPGETEKDTKVYTPDEVNQKKDTPKKTDTSSATPLSQETQDAASIPGDAKSTTKKSDKFIAEEMKPKATPKAVPKNNDTAKKSAATADSSRRSEKSFQKDAQAGVAEKDKLPHLEPPPCVHYFDTYTLVREVEAGGFTSAQAITAMKAVRSILAENLDVARQSLVSKGDVENEAYLFEAACSELKTEVQNARKLNDEKMRTERTLLEHEVESLNQKLTQGLAILRDELKGMFDDRRMEIRAEQRNMDAAIQGLNYKITVDLSSDAKSDVEGLRWLVSRRAALGILIMAFMVLCSLRYAKYREHLEEEETKKARKAKADKEAKLREPSNIGALEGLAAN